MKTEMPMHKILFLIIVFAAVSLAAAEFPVIAPSGEITVDGLTFRIEHYSDAWKMTALDRRSIVAEKEGNTLRGTFEVPGGVFAFSETVSPIEGKTKAFSYLAQLTAKSAIPTNLLALNLILPVNAFRGMVIARDGKPFELVGDGKLRMLDKGSVKSLVLPGETGNVVITGDIRYRIEYNTSKGDAFLLRLLFDSKGGNDTLDLRFAYEELHFTNLDLGKAANRGFLDEEDADGKGGWPDQGKERDLRSLVPGVKQVGNYSFHIIDPEKNGGRSCIMLGGVQRPNLPLEASVEAPGETFHYLYLIHSGAWVRDSKQIGSVTACYEDGSKEEFPIRNNIEILDWSGGLARNNCKIAWTGKHLFGQVYLYFTRLELDKQKKLTEVIFTSNGVGAWGIFAVNGQNSEVPAFIPSAAQTQLFTRGKDWPAIVNTPRPVVKGSALDLSGTLDAPAGKYGKVVARNGQFEFEKLPGKKQFFWGTNICQQATVPDRKTAEFIADSLAACGYNAVRFHHFDVLMTDPGDSVITKNENLDRMFYLMSLLRERGIYYTIDLFTQRRLSDEFAKIPLIDLIHTTKHRLPYDNALLENMKSFAADLLTRVNPYTKVALKDDLALMPFNIINENNIFSDIRGYPAAQEKYRELANKAHPEMETLSNEEQDNACGRFIIEMQQKIYRDMKTHLLKVGATQATSDMNVSAIVAQVASRNQYDYIDNHYYHALYPFYAKGPVVQDQSAPSERWFRFPLYLAPTRIFGKPFAANETQICYANGYRMQYAALMAAFGGLQGWDQVLHYSWSHSTRPFEAAVPTDRLNYCQDPLMVIADRIPALMKLRKSSIFIPYVVTTEHINSVVRMTNGGPGFPAEYCRLGMFARIGSVLADRDLPELKDALFLVVPAEMKIPDYLKQYPIVRDNADLPAELKKYPIPAGTGFDGKQVVSSTGELVYEIDRSLRMVTPEAEALLLQDGCSELAGTVMAVRENRFPSVCFLGALDGKALTDSRRMLFLYLTDLKNDGTQIQSGSQLVTPGKLPLIVRSGKVGVELKLAGEPQVWALDYTGARKKRIPATKTAQGIQFHADSVTDKDAVYAFEIVRDRQ